MAQTYSDWSHSLMPFDSSEHVAQIHSQLGETSIFQDILETLNAIRRIVLKLQLRIIVTGDSHSGRSTFINKMLKYPQAPVATTFEKETTRILEYPEPKCPYPIVTLVDTPGISGTSDYKPVKTMLLEYVKRVTQQDALHPSSNVSFVNVIGEEQDFADLDLDKVLDNNREFAIIVLVFVKCGNRFEDAHKDLIRMFWEEKLPVLIVISIAGDMRKAKLYQDEILLTFSNCPTVALLVKEERVGGTLVRPYGMENVVTAICELAKESITSTLHSADTQAEDLQSKLGDIRILVCGDSGSGKSTLVNAVFGLQLASTSEARPCTSKITEYPRPDDLKKGHLKLVDTKGFETNDFKAIFKDLKKYVSKAAKSKNIADRIDVAYYCMKDGKAVDKMHKTVIDYLNDQKLLVIIVQTQCTSDEKNRELFTDDLKKQFDLTVVPVLAVAEGDIAAFGLEALTEETVQRLPESKKTTFVAVQQCNLKQKVQLSIGVTVTAVTAAGLTSAIPLPGANVVALFSTVVTMLTTISAIFGLQIKLQFIISILKRVILGTAGVVVGREVCSNMLKLVPGVGTVAGTAIQAVTGGALTLALGIEYTRILYTLHMEGHSVTAETVEKLFRDSMPDVVKMMNPKAVARLLKNHDSIRDSIIEKRPLTEIEIGIEATDDEQIISEKACLKFVSDEDIS